MHKARNYYYYGFGQVIGNQDLSASLASHEISARTGVNLSKAGIHQVQNVWQLPFRCNAPDCICTRSRGNHLYDDVPLPSPAYIRLLEILPGTEDNIECHLHLAKISQVVNAYEALSYTWKSSYGRQRDAPIAKINCNGHEIEVGDNLFAALRRIRHSSNSRIIWADALCINQTDQVERSMQVQRMGEIFESAARVLIWLEDRRKAYTSDDRVAYRAFSAVCNIVNGWRERSPFRDEIPIATHSHHIDHPEEHSTDDIVAPDSTEWQPVFELFKSTWFHRVWVIQEAVRAKVAVLFWEDCEISWSHVGTVAAIIRNNFGRISSSARTRRAFPRRVEPPLRSIPSGITNAYFMYRLSESQSFFEPLSFTFHELLKLTRQFNCKDDRDRVYGLLGLPTSDGLSSIIKPDYTKSTQKLYLEVASKILDSSSSLALLSSVQENRKVSSPSCGFIYDNRHRPVKLDPRSAWQVARYGNEPEEDYPSWVPQWQFIFTTSLAPPTFHPAFSPSGDKQVVRRECKDKQRLELKGVIVDTIEECQYSLGFFGFHRGASQADRDMGNHARWGPRPDDLDMLLPRIEQAWSKLETLALFLTGGKNWYGFPIEDKSAHLADYAKCLLKEGCLWSIRDDFIFSEPPKVKDDESEEPGVKRQKVGGVQNIEAKHQWELQNKLEPTDTSTKTKLQILGQTGNADRFLDACATACRNRCFFRTSTRLQGIGPQCIQHGDLLCVFYGATVPFVIRPDGEGRYLVVGECFVHEIMAGKVIEQMAVPESGLKETWITLV
jgi:hypothetical protein